MRSMTTIPGDAFARLRPVAAVARILAAALAVGYLAAQACLHVAFWLGDAGLVVVSRCLSGAGATAWWATHLAMVRVDAACPEGTLALGGAPADIAVVLATIALPALLAQAALLVVAGGLLAALRTTLRTVRQVVSNALVVPASAPVLAPLCRVRLAPRPLLRRARVRVGGQVPVRRGPPVLAA